MKFRILNLEKYNQSSQSFNNLKNHLKIIKWLYSTETMSTSQSTSINSLEKRKKTQNLQYYNEIYVVKDQ